MVSKIVIDSNDLLINAMNDLNIIDMNDIYEYKRTLIVGPIGCGKPSLLLNQLKLLKLIKNDMSVKVITRSNEQYEDKEVFEKVELFWKY